MTREIATFDDDAPLPAISIFLVKSKSATHDARPDDLSGSLVYLGMHYPQFIFQEIEPVSERSSL
jgi:hypothetical protein